MDDENALRGKLFAAAWRGDFDSVKEIIETKVIVRHDLI